MKRTASLLAALIAVPAFQPALAQVRDRSEIDLPEWEWILPLTSPVMFQREGVLAPEETPFWRDFWPLLRGAQYEEALRLFRQNYIVPDDMEKGIVHSPVLDSDDVSAALFYMLGQTYFFLERNDPAETAFRSALNYLPDYTRAHESLGYLYLEEERYDEAREHLSRAAALGLNTASLFGSLGFLNQATDNPWGAVSAYQQAMALDGDNEQWQRGLLNALNSSRNYGSAFALVEQLLDVHPNDPDLWVYRAFLAQRTRDDASALASLETAIRLGEDSAANLQVCATLHMQIGSVARATELLGRGFVSGMDYLYVDQALVWLMREGEWANVGELIEDARPRVGDLRDVQRSRFLTREASLATHNGQSELALERLDEALELDGTNADALMELAALYRSRDDYGQAELFYQRASAFEEYRENAALSLAQLAIDQTEYQRALELLRDIVEQNALRFDLRRNIEILENLVDLRSGI